MTGPLQRLGDFERRVLAFGLAPLGAGAACLAVEAGLVLASDSPRWRLSRLDESLLVAGAAALYAAPFAWLAAPLLIACLRRRGWLDFRRVACAGTLLGGGWFLGVVLLERLDRGWLGGGREWLLVPLGAWCGFAAATTYWLLGEHATGRAATKPAG